MTDRDLTDNRLHRARGEQELDLGGWWPEGRPPREAFLRCFHGRGIQQAENIFKAEGRTYYRRGKRPVRCEHGVDCIRVIPASGRRMVWSERNLRGAAWDFRKRLAKSGLAPSTQKTYLQGAERFLEHLMGDHHAGDRKRPSAW